MHFQPLSLGDIYYIAFRHKRKIILISALGILFGLALPLVYPRTYQSEAKLLIKYVLDNRLPSEPGGNEPRATLPDAAGRNIINTELQILTSMDVAEEVATNIGPDKILGKTGASAVAAAALIKNNLTLEVPNNSDVIRLVFKHRDPVLVRDILSQIIDTYKQRHAEIHRPGGDDEVLNRETDELRSRLTRTEEALRSAKTNLHIISLDDARTFFSSEMKELQTDLFNSQAELAEHQAALDVLSKRVKLEQVGTNVAPVVEATNTVPAEVVTEYKRVVDMLDAFRRKEKDLRVVYLPGSQQIKDIEGQIASAEKERKQLVSENPGLAATKAPELDSKDNQQPSDLQQKLIGETSLVAGLQRRINVLTNELDNVRRRSADVEAGANAIDELERTRKMEEEHLTYYSESRENSLIDEALGPGKGSNINEIENPSPAFVDDSSLKKARIGLCAGGILLAFGLAFLIEMYLDHTLRRPAEVEARLGIPLFLSIPYRNGNGHARLLKGAPKTALVIKSEALGRTVPLTSVRTGVGRAADNAIVLTDGSVSGHHCEILVREGEMVIKDLGSANGTFINGERVTEAALKAGQMLRLGQVELRIASEEVANGQAATTADNRWNPHQGLRPFYDALRDRLITFFEIKNLTHKPKLVALTSCGEGAGVTSIATGLAAALSETGEGNVLVVDMNNQNGGAACFHKGHLASGLDDALSKDKRHEALVQSNLYAVAEGTRNDSVAPFLPKRFTNLVPQLKASDYDYIIFDMPAISQISITPRLARFMDMLLVVVESEKTDRDVVQRAVTMLGDSSTNLGIILNKRKKYVPKQLQQEL